jgi:hypothetical protein
MSTALVLLPAAPESVPGVGRFDQLRTAVLNGVAAENSKCSYALAIDELALGDPESRLNE